MSLQREFLKERTEISAMRAAHIYAWRGYAYKCFDPGYPAGWIRREVRQHAVLEEAGLPVPRFYESEFSNTIKMDLLADGSLAERLHTEDTDRLLDKFMHCFRQIHTVTGLDFPGLSGELSQKIAEAPGGDDKIRRALRFFEEVEQTVSEQDVLCHMQYSLQNVYVSGETLKVTDWTHARMGKPIWDYARTYVLLYEEETGIEEAYAKRVRAREGYPEELFEKAVYVSALCRQREKNTGRLKELLHPACYLTSGTSITRHP